MKGLMVMLLLSFLISSCSKKEDCYCNTGNGEYSYLPPSNQIHNPSSSVNAYGNLEEECGLQDGYLKANSSVDSYCLMK